MYQIIESITNLDVKLLEQTDMPKSVNRTLSMATVIPIFQIILVPGAQEKNTPS